MKMKIIFLVFGLIAGGILGAAAMSIVQQAKSPAAPTNNGTQATLEGIIICLPHKNTDPNKPQTLECAIGLQTTDNKTYGLVQSGNITTLSSAAGSDKKYRISGTLGPATNDIYKTDGTLTVKSYEALP